MLECTNELIVLAGWLMHCRVAELSVLKVSRWSDVSAVPFPNLLSGAPSPADGQNSSSEQR